MVHDIQEIETLSGEAVALCQLLGKILFRCLNERDIRIFPRVSSSTSPDVEKQEVVYE